uniref:Uncharacterized protein n=1 Tax=Manihot esculenta TaxID=3983 RepID=A0A2C9VQ82_MANES
MIAVKYAQNLLFRWINFLNIWKYLNLSYASPQANLVAVKKPKFGFASHTNSSKLLFAL